MRPDFLDQCHVVVGRTGIGGTSGLIFIQVAEDHFEHSDGLRCVEGLLDALDDPTARAKISFVDGVIDDLTALRDVLVVAKKRKAKFRLEIA